MNDDSNEDARQPRPVIPASEGANALPYETPRDRTLHNPPTNIIVVIFLVLLGVAISLAGVCFVSAFLFLSINPLEGHQAARQTGSLLTGCLYLLAFAAILWIALRYYRRLDRHRLSHWLIIGLLIGLGIGCLIEGCCFIA